MGYDRLVSIPLVLGALVLSSGAHADAALCDELAGAPLLPGSTGNIPDYTKIDSERAIPVCTEAVRKNPTNIPTTYRLVRALAAAKRWDELEAPLKRSLDANYGPAYTMLGILQFNGLGRPNDQAASLASYSRAVELGYKPSAYSVAWFHYTGTIVPENRAEAARYYLIAAEGNLAVAQTQYALLLLNGNGIERNDKEAYRWAQRAAKLQDAYGSYLTGFMLENGRGTEKNLDAAVQAYAASAAGGHNIGQTNYGRMLEEGRGIDSDPQRARVLYRDAAGANNAEAQARLGRMLRLGHGGPKDLNAARSLLVKAGAQPIAQHQLGLMDWYGEAGPQNRQTAFAMIRKAAEAGFAEAQVDAAKIMTTTDGGEPYRDERAAVGYLQKAAGKQNAEAMFLLGNRLIDGDGVAKDVDRGLKMLDAAAVKGHWQAKGMAVTQRALIRLEAEQAALAEKRCNLDIKLCNRGCVKQDDDTYIFNTHDGKTWFHQSGRLLPKSDWPDYGCPQ